MYLVTYKNYGYPPETTYIVADDLISAAPYSGLTDARLYEMKEINFSAATDAKQKETERQRKIQEAEVEQKERAELARLQSKYGSGRRKK